MKRSAVVLAAVLSGVVLGLPTAGGALTPQTQTESTVAPMPVAAGSETTAPPTLPPVLAGVATTVAPSPDASAPPSIVPAGDAIPPSTQPSPTTSVVGASTTVAPRTSTTIAPPARTVAELRQRVLNELAPVSNGISAVILIDGVGRVVDLNASIARPPASTLKVFTGGAALLTLGPEYRFVTSVRALGTVSASGVLDGDLVLVGGGDPTLTTADLTALATQIAAAGITRVTGRLLVDDRRFEPMIPAVGWKPSFVPGEVGKVSAFLVDRNRRNEADPSVANLERLRSALGARKVVVVGGSQRSLNPVDGRVVATRSSQPLTEIVTHMMKRSDNTEAEVILREIGASFGGTGSSSTGVAGLTRQFDRFGIARPTLYDGSGLSSSNRVTADSMVAWLTAMSASKVAVPFQTSLPIACSDGTLKGRMCKTSAANNVRAKTGYINNVVSLAGYGTTASGRRVTFAIIGSDLRSTSTARAAIDRSMVAVTSSLL
jgi:serine-type D-Ala-D-Ala carboxypeptidase/endopeptidase (penicillin-binding protein 4)